MCVSENILVFAFIKEETKLCVRVCVCVYVCAKPCKCKMLVQSGSHCFGLHEKIGGHGGQWVG